ncbi:DSD1 family PLP-dependent enzyme [Minwuia thermotolerans]|uniref:Alanine racemase n=1 Tax=Minwuia thermotolerans TaxID=2056226 RepID=A0A2M9FZ89_9PROT|nr:DSD1 family PLP-dependent enzyme [Minwuia thermotolerans]PJK28770.1 alanine racemase [Minwuia thermotolerans]
MSLPPPARVGDPLESVDTPALVIDLEVLDRNIAAMQDIADARGVALRPHAKSHKSADIARRQMACGAVGICCQKISEAELMATGGVDDILVTNQIVGARKIGRLSRLARHVRLGVCVDDTDNLAEIAAAARHSGAELDIYVEVEVGMGRCGVAPEKAGALCRAAAAEEGVRFAGLQAYNGRAQHIRDHRERGAAIARAGEAVRVVLADLEQAGLGGVRVTGAGTGSFEFEAGSGLWHELQAGSYIFMDADYARNLGPEGTPETTFGHSLFVLAGVLSTAPSGRVVVDAGLKALAVDSGLPLVAGPEGAAYLGASDEHGVVDPGGAALRPGDHVRLIPGHCDPTVNLHDWIVGARDGFVTDIWPVTARGAVF